MIRTIKATIDEEGRVRLLEQVHLSATHRALVTILEDEALGDSHDIALMSEKTLAADWTRPEEDAAWSHFQRVP